MEIRYVYIVISLLLIIATYIKEKNIVCPIIIFNALWCFVFWCAITNNMVTAAGSSTYFLFFIGVVCLDLGCYVSDKLKFKKIRIKNYKVGISDGDYKLRKGLIYFLILLCILYYFLNFALLIKSVGNFNLSDIMQMVNTDDTLTKKYKIVNFIYTMIVNPFSYIIPFIVAADYWVGNRDRKLFYLSFTMLLLRLFSSGNRLSFMFIFIFMVVVGLLIKRIDASKMRARFSLKDKMKARFLIIGLTIFAVIVFIYSTVSRGYDVKANIFINFAIPLRMYEIWSESISSKGEYGFGFASFQGLIYPIFYLLKNIIGLPMPSHISDVFDLTTQTVTEWVSGGTYMHNAYVSIFWYFYYDFRIIGIIFLSFTMGILAQKAYRRAISKPNIKSVALYCVYVRMLIGSYAEMPFSNIGFGVGLFFLLFVVYKQKNNMRTMKHEQIY